MTDRTDADSLRRRRALTALLAATSVLAVFGGLAGFVQGSEPGEPLPEQYSIASPRVGDQASYDYVRLARNPDGTTRILNQTPNQKFEWLPSREIHDADGIPHKTNRLATTPIWMFSAAPNATTGQHEWGILMDLDAQTRQTVAMGIANEHQSQYSAGFALGLVNTTTRINTGIDLTLFPRSDASTPSSVCGLWSPMQGAAAPILGGIRMEPCYANTALAHESNATMDADGLRTHLHGFSASAVWMPVRQEMLGPIPTLVFSARGMFDEPVYAWFSPDFPYPVQIAFVPKAEGAPVHLLALTRFARGTQALSGAAPTSLTPASAPQWTAPTKWGMDDSGTNRPFRLVDAAKKATEDPRAPFTLLMQRSNAYLFSADYSEYKEGGRMVRTWALFGTDGTETVGLALQRIEEPPAGISLLDGLAEPSIRYAYSNKSAQAPSQEPGPIPPKVPTLGSLERAWRDYSGATEPVNNWGFTFACLMTPCRPQAYFTVGHTSIQPASMASRVAPTGEAGQMRFDMFALTLDVAEDDAVPMLLKLHQNSTWTIQPAGDPAVGRPEPVGIEAQSSFAWRAPNIATTLTVGFLALLAGLVSWSWPWLRSLLVALFFTRFSGPQLLDHPARQEILQRIEQSPGVHFMELARLTGLGHGALDHHLRLLARADIIHAVGGAGYRCYVRAGAHDRRIVAGLPILKSSGARQILDAVARRPGIRGREIALAVSISEPTVSYHLKRLEKAGMVRRDVSSGPGRYHATEFAGPAQTLAARTVDVNA